ncbi:hypothetical protein GGE65_005386 [Skermanella aerolata]|uniref:hypothetical protein n=1 Tax=Skermanella aerolata TaxID=393310 RepID=UPI003D25AF35
MRFLNNLRACLLASTAVLSASVLSAPPAAAADTVDYGVELPDPKIPGYMFPTPEPIIIAAVDTADASGISLHGWGLWTSLTTPSHETAFAIPNAPVYLTWLTKQELVALSKSPSADAGAKVSGAATAPARSRSMSLKPVTQLEKFGIDSTASKAQPRTARTATASATGVSPDTNIFEVVAYDPEAAKFINENKLFDLTTIAGLYKSGKKAVPDFPAPSVAIKPVYKIISAADLIDGKYYAMPAWPGTPVTTDAIVADGFPETVWPGCVYVDVTNKGASTATGIDGACGGQTAASTYGLGDFISYPVTAANVAAFNAVDSTNGYKVAVGDYLLLMAMHVTSREIREWTWQTFFWTPAPMNPPTPSSVAIAGAQPKQLGKPAAHYAMSIAYQMISPNQPVTGGSNTGKPMIAYNPYLESDFSASTFSVSRAVTDPNTGVAWTGQVGVETNCMTCHSMASVKFGTGGSTGYGTTFYVSLDDPMFDGTVQTDFLWSIADVVSTEQKDAKAAGSAAGKK